MPYSIALDDPRLTPAEDADIRRRLRQELTILWHSPPIRADRPGPLDEVRTAMAFFDETLFLVTPQFQRAVGTAGPTVRWGSWIGGDRDGNPNVTAAVTREAVRIQADHVLRAYEAVCRRLMQTVSARGRSRRTLWPTDSPPTPGRRPSWHATWSSAFPARLSGSALATWPSACAVPG